MPRTSGRSGLTMLVDGSSMIYRAFFAVPDTVRAPSGEPVNGAYGFLNMLARLIVDRHPASVLVATDEDWRPSWRVDLIEEYKLHRVAAEDAEPDPVEPQIALCVELLELAGIAVAGCESYEAEDVIGTFVERARGEVAIVSGDRDLFQLVRDPDVYVLFPVRGVSELTKIDESYIREKYGIPGRAYADFAVLRGDPSDGLPGVRGIGAKSATDLIAKYGSLDAVVEAAKNAKAGPLAKVAVALDYVGRARKVVAITGEAPAPEIDITLGSRAASSDLKARADELGLSGPVERLLQALQTD
ncbi:MAG: 5'-3' exonuclease H3TH domain-containing protein [Actinomycetota bacterium]